MPLSYLQSCSPGQVEVVIAVKTDSWPTETSWELSNICTSTTEKKSTPYDGTDKNKEFSDTLCVDPGQYKFAIYDQFSDGICCGYGNGSYSVMYDGKQEASGGFFDASEESTFGDPCQGADPTPPPTKSPTPPPTISVSAH